MKDSITYISKVIEGKLSPTASKAIRQLLATLEGEVVNITIGKRRNPRSLNQNAYWFKLLQDQVVPIFRQAGSDWDAWKVHEFLVKELGYVDVLVTPNGEPKETRMQTSKMNKAEFSELIERAKAHLATEYEIYVTDL